MTMPIDAKTFRPTSFGRIYRCTRCSLGAVQPRPTPADTASFYDLESYYTQGKSHMVEVDAPGFLSRLRTHLAWRADTGENLETVIADQLSGGSAVVDIGCGAGRLLDALASRGYRVTGVERDASSVSRRGDNLAVLEGSAESLPAALQPGAFDGAVFSHVLEHLVDPAGAVRAAATLLKPAGLMFIEVPNNASSIARQSLLAWGHLDVPRHINFFDRQSLLALAAAAGLAVRKTYFGGYGRYFYDSYVATEQRIFDRLTEQGYTLFGTKRNSSARAWRLLAKTALADAHSKYDSVGIVAARI
ncbi:MAG: class I SAM-dependent methyltransferase [Rhizobiales bacterium]|nr:class I SAM-dependent methyltransferase [Rhizobacter sp.]